MPYFKLSCIFLGFRLKEMPRHVHIYKSVGEGGVLDKDLKKNSVNIYLLTKLGCLEFFYIYLRNFKKWIYQPILKTIVSLLI